MDSQLDSSFWPVRAIVMLLAAFATGSLLIALVGQYAVVTFGLRRRRRDLGVRMALGASSQVIMRAVLREGLVQTLAGLVAGFALSRRGGRDSRLAVRREPDRSGTYAAVFVLLGITSLAACVTSPLVARRGSIPHKRSGKSERCPRSPIRF